MVEFDEKIFPNEYVIFKLSDNKSPSEVTLRSTEWAVITQVDGLKSVDEISQNLSLSSDEAVNLFNGLYEKELIEVSSTQKPKENFLDENFYAMLETELTKVIGPVAPLLLEESLWDMDSKKERFPMERLPELVEHISDEISDNDKKVKFQQVMLRYLKEIK